MELAVFEERCLTCRLAVLQGEDLLLERVDILRGQQEYALVEVKDLGVRASADSLHLLTPGLILGLQDGRFEEFEKFEVLVFEDVLGGGDIYFAVLIRAVLIVDHVCYASVNDKLVPEPGIQLCNNLVQSLQRANLLNSLSFEGVKQIILAVLELAA